MCWVCLIAFWGSKREKIHEPGWEEEMGPTQILFAVWKWNYFL